MKASAAATTAERSPKSAMPKPAKTDAAKSASKPPAKKSAATSVTPTASAEAKSVHPPSSTPTDTGEAAAPKAAAAQAARPATVAAPATQPNPPAACAGEAPATPAVGRPMPPLNTRPQVSRASSKDEVFAEGDYVVYPTHGVGRVERIAVEEIAGHRLELIHITFEENRMTLRVPVAKARSAGLRKLATRSLFDEAMAVLKGKARIKRTMWSRRAQEYEAKINSGDPIAIAEVERDLHRNAGQPDQSFSERQIYEAAMDRLAAELAALDQTDKATAAAKLAAYLKTIS
jgi:CarD family transcriptional regulator